MKMSGGEDGRGVEGGEREDGGSLNLRSSHCLFDARRLHPLAQARARLCPSKYIGSAYTPYFSDLFALTTLP